MHQNDGLETILCREGFACPDLMLITSKPNFLSVEIADRVLSAVHPNLLQISVEAHPSSCESIPMSSECFVGFVAVPEAFDCSKAGVELSVVSRGFRIFWFTGCPFTVLSDQF
tara:strand:- start:705 stop:1043 length:339 start_codon:yes stop_codon:yes gene_type:complete